MGLAPEERKSQGLVLAHSVTHNITLSSLARFASGGFLRRGTERAAAQEQTRSLEVRPPASTGR
jgi:ribose transport system ATP-binding protein